MIRRPAMAPVIAAILLSVLVPPSGRAQEPESLQPAPVAATIVYPDGRPTESATVLTSGGTVWLTAQDLSSIFRAVRFWRADVRKLTFQFSSHEIAVTVGSEVSVIDHDTAVHLDGPVLYQDGLVYVPLSFLEDKDGKPLPWLPQPVTWDAATHRIHVGGLPPGLVAVNLADDRLDLVVTEPRDFRLLSTSRTRFILRLPGVTADLDSLKIPPGNENFMAITVRPVPEGVDLSFAVPDTIVGYQVLKVPGPHRVSVLLSDDARFVTEGKVEPFAETGGGGVSMTLGTVVLDPGHGGADSGARSPGGLREADLSLSLAREVALLLESRLGVHAVLTRDDDRDVSIAARAEVANMAKADLFVSLHFDSWPSGGVKGPLAVVAQSDASPERVAGRLAELGFEPWNGAQDKSVGKARLLAQELVSGLSDATGEAARGVEEWPLPLLLPVRMPAVFLEVDALSAAGSDRRLSGDDARAKLASAIVDAIDRYRRTMP